MNDKMVPGDYTSLGLVNIRSQMKTMPATNIVGAYTNGVNFRVYEVYPEVDGILWGRVSSNTGAGQARYIALRVANNEKVHLEKADEPNNDNQDSLVSVIRDLTSAIRELSNK